MVEVYDLMIPQYQKERESISFFQCGIEHCMPDHSNGPKLRLYTSIHFVLEGKGYLVINNKKIPVHEGQAFLLPANMEIYYCADNENPWRYCWIDFFGNEKEQYSERIFGKENYVKSDLPIPEIFKLIKDTVDIFSMGDAEEDEKYGEKIYLYSVQTLSQLLKANATLYNIMALMLEEEEINDKKDSTNYLDQIKNYIDSCFGEINAVSEIAMRFHLHPNYLTSIFKQKYHISPKKYLLERKIDYASYLLIETDYTVQDIAQRCGFISAASFGKIYKKYKRMTPGDFRKRVREQKQN